jgi:S-adenosylmethionine hydrolase
MPVLTLLTDFGLDDYYVAAVKGVVLSRAPGTTLVDIAHTVPAGDVAAGSFLLRAAAPWFPAGTVHLAVVDPGVGSERRILVAESGGFFFVGPDNGLLTPFLEGATVRAVERADLYLESSGHTFHGRDRFAPVAAALLEGCGPADLGPEVADPVRLASAEPRREGGRLEGTVIHVDRYGNLVTDLPTAWLPADVPCRAAVGGYVTGIFATHYAAVPAGEPALLPGSLGTLELALPHGDLAHRWRVERGAQVTVSWE